MYRLESGYSKKANLPEFRKKAEHQGKGSLKPFLILAVAVLGMAIFLLLGIFNVLSLSLALILGGIFGLLLVIISFLLKRDKEDSPGYTDARVVQKKLLRKKDPQGEGDIIYLVVFQRKDGDEKKMNFAKHKDLYQYYELGDYVRFHKGFPYPEKREKEFDSEIVCVSCGKLNHLDHDRCRGCHVLLLK